jgi:hypothetical protein
VIGLGLRQVQDALNHKADDIQHEFVALSERLELISHQIMEVRGEDRQQMRAEQESLRAKQADLAAEINIWRERSRAVLQQRGETALKAYLEELKTLNDTLITFAVDLALRAIESPEEVLAELEAGHRSSGAVTPAARLLQRARTEYDLRGSDVGPRQRTAVEFANRPGMGQDDKALAEVEAGMEDPDPIVREVATLTCIQLLRFRAIRLAELDKAHEAVQRLAALQHMAAVRPLVEVVSAPRSGFVEGPNGPEEATNQRSRMVALLRLVEWHTADAQAALRGLRFDRDPHIVKAAEKALNLFPGDWKGPLKDGAASSMGDST